MPTALGLAFLFLFLFSLIGSGSFARADTNALVEKALSLHLDTDREWLLLLDYQKGLFGGYKSQADGPKYFLSPTGKKSPRDELIKNIQDIFSGDTVDTSARCRFPARTFYLAKKLDVPVPSDAKCTEWLKFYSSFKADSVSVVFSAYFVNNPSSTFGHTFLRFNQKRSYQDTDLTDLSVNFAASAWTKNPILYSVGGMAGWFPGVFSTIPYYYKVREYNNFESRDLWSYQLDLTLPEIDQLIRHLWEYRDTYFDYYFFSENCSYHLMTAIEAAAPRLRLVEKLHAWVMPSDTILNIYNQKITKEISFRPSARNIFSHSFDRLNKLQQKEFFRIIQNREVDVSWQFSPADRVQIIDVVLDWIDYKYNIQVKDEKSWQYQWNNTLLERRAELPTVQEVPVPEPDVKPHLGHSSERAGISAGYNNKVHDFQRISMRFALHDLLDPQGGYPDNVQIEFLNFTFQTRDHFSDWDLYQFRLVDVISLNPWTSFEKGFSWKMAFGSDTFQNKDCKYCQGALANFGAGFSLDIFKNATFFLLAQVEPLYAQKFINHQFRVKTGPEIGLLFKPAFNFKMLAQYDLYYDLVQKTSIYAGEFSLRKSFNNNFSAGTKTKIENDVLENSLEAFYFF